MPNIEFHGGRESVPALEHRNVFQAALMMHWNPSAPELQALNEHDRAMAWVQRYAAAYADLYGQQGTELIAGSAKNPEMLAKWQQKLDAYLRRQALSEDLAKLQPLD